MNPSESAALEREVIRLRSECCQFAKELERRYQHIVELPHELRTIGAPRLAARTIRRHPVFALASVTIVACAIALLLRRR